MIIVYSKNSIPIRLTKERWAHIITRHPEMKGEREKVIETISNPELIQAGDVGELLAVRFYAETPLTKKYLVVIYKEVSKQDGFVLTAYFSTRISERRRVVWKQ
jgi:hypothetical protein